MSAEKIQEFLSEYKVIVMLRIEQSSCSIAEILKTILSR